MRHSIALLLVAAATLQAQTSRHELRGRRVAVYNLVGTLRVEGGSGSAVSVELTRRGRDASRLRVESGDVGGTEALRVIYPADRVVAPAEYRREGRWGWRGQRMSRLRVESDGTFGDGWRSRGDDVEIVSEGRGLEAAADLTVSVPKGQQLALHLAVGEVIVRNVDGEIDVDVHAASLEASGTSGVLRLDTGSGEVTVRDAQGELEIDSGSGSVQVTGMRGRSLRMDTGSGSLTATRVVVDELRLDSGSGRVTLRDVQAPDLTVDTGSGGVEVELTADVERMMVESGSGGITIGIPRSLGAEIDVRTGSGGIDLDVPVTARRTERRRLTGTVGDGKGRMVVETGSGGVRIRESMSRQ